MDAARRRVGWRIGLDLLLIGYGLAAFALVPLCWLSAVRAETLGVRAFGVLVFVAFVALGVILVRAHGGRARSRGLLVLFAASGCGAAAIALAFVASAPSGHPSAEAAVRSEFSGGVEYPRYSIGNIVPELDQAAMGISVAAALDRYLDSARADRLRRIVLPVYREMAALPEYRELGSAMMFAYSDLLGGETGVGHDFEYIPPHAAEEKLGLLIFLHGSAGNFATYLHVWRPLADAQRLMIICPTYGFGNWQRGDALAVVERAMQALPADPERIYLAGLSQGGAGVTRTAPELAGKLRGVILLSPILDGRAIDDPRWAKLRTVIAHGEDDERIPADYVRDGIKRLRAAGSDVTERWYPGEDHFLFFARRAEVLTELVAWMRH